MKADILKFLNTCSDTKLRVTVVLVGLLLTFGLGALLPELGSIMLVTTTMFGCFSPDIRDIRDIRVAQKAAFLKAKAKAKAKAEAKEKAKARRAQKKLEATAAKNK